MNEHLIEVDTDRVKSTIRKLLNRPFVVLFKHILYLGALLLIMAAAFQYQVEALSEQRFDTLCDSRIAARADMRATLFHMVNLSDVLPDDPLAEQYTDDRIAYINERIPALTEEDCS